MNWYLAINHCMTFSLTVTILSFNMTVKQKNQWLFNQTLAIRLFSHVRLTTIATMDSVEKNDNNEVTLPEKLILTCKFWRLQSKVFFYIASLQSQHRIEESHDVLMKVFWPINSNNPLLTTDDAACHPLLDRPSPALSRESAPRTAGQTDPSSVWRDACWWCGGLNGGVVLRHGEVAVFVDGDPHVVGGEDGEEVLLLALRLGQVVCRSHQELDSLREVGETAAGPELIVNWCMLAQS